MAFLDHTFVSQKNVVFRSPILVMRFIGVIAMFAMIIPIFLKDFYEYEEFK